MNQRTKWILSAIAGVVCLAAFLGWRGSNLARQASMTELARSINSEIRMGGEIFETRLNLFASEVFNIVSAEFFHHASHAPGVTQELSDSHLLAVGILEQKGEAFEPAWLSISSKSRDSVSMDLLRGVLPELQPQLKQMGRHYFFRAVDAKSVPLMIFFSRIELPNSRSPAMAVALITPNQLKIGSSAMKDGWLWDQNGYIWSYSNPAYVGAQLKEDPLVTASLESNDDTGRLKFVDNNKQRLGAYARLPDTNLYVGVARIIPPISHFLFNWWFSLVFGLAGAVIISLASSYRSDEEDTALVMPMIVDGAQPTAAAVEPAARPAPAPALIEETPDPIEMASLPLDFVEPQAPVPKPPALNPEPALVFPTETLTGVALDPVIHRALAGVRTRCLELEVNVQVRTIAGLQVGAKAAQLQTALEELIKNALDAMENCQERHLIIEAIEENSVVKIAIRDSGVGIAPEHHEKIFDAFFTTRPESSRGLGLTVVKRMLEFVDGDVMVNSEPGTGTVFSLFLPKPGAKVSAVSTLDLDDDADEPSFHSGKLPDLEVRRPQVRMFD